jgi:hypothetical protein
MCLQVNFDTFTINTALKLFKRITFNYYKVMQEVIAGCGIVSFFLQITIVCADVISLECITAII